MWMWGVVFHIKNFIDMKYKKNKILLSSWNINSIRARKNQINTWVNKENPDVVLLQETKTPNLHFPFSAFNEKKYHCITAGQKSYNGVAIITNHKISNIKYNILNKKEEARYIEAIIDDNLKVASIYIPNGTNIGHIKYFYKMKIESCVSILFIYHYNL